MAHSYRRHVKLAFLSIEILLFAAAAVSTYFSATSNWPWFWVIAVISLVLFATVRIVDATPQLNDLLAFEDSAAQMADSAVQYGVQRFYNMQSSHDQDARNKDTIFEINKADAMWLCANSGASYLDPSVYRHWGAVEKRLKQGVPFKVVLLDPLSEAKRLRNKLNIGEEAVDSKVNLQNLVRLYNKYPSLEIHFVREGMHASVFATPVCLFYDPYHVSVVGQRIENRSFCLKIAQSTPIEGVGYYGLLRGHFDSLWRDSQDFDSWVRLNNQYLGQTLPKLNLRHG